MAVAIEDLIEPTKVATNGVGGSIVAATDPQWAVAIRNGFWRAKNLGFFDRYRLDVNNDYAITPVPPDTEDMPGEVQQLVVEITALEQLELAVIGLDTEFSAKSGEEEISTRRAASAITEVLKARRAALEQLRQRLVEDPRYAGYVGVADLVALRVGSCYSSAQTWVG